MSDSVTWFYDNQGSPIALVVREKHNCEGVDFLTPDSFGQQLALMSRPAGHVIEAHTHLPVNRDLVGTQEVIFMRSGKLRLDLYDNDRTYLQSTILHSGDVALLCGGGHGFESLEDAVFWEVKQGPYSPENDKVRFEATHKQQFIGL